MVKAWVAMAAVAGETAGGGPRSAIATNTPFPRPAPVRRRRYYNAIIAGGGAVGLTLARLLLDNDDSKGGDGLVLEQRCRTNAVR